MRLEGRKREQKETGFGFLDLLKGDSLLQGLVCGFAPDSPE